MRPANLAGLVINRLDHALAPQVIVGAGPAVRAVGWLGKIDAVAGMSSYDEQSGLGIKTGRAKVGHPTLVRRDQTSIGRRLLGRIGNGMTLFVNPEGPVHRPKRHGE